MTMQPIKFVNTIDARFTVLYGKHRRLNLFLPGKM